MRVALHSTFAASKKEPLVEMMGRVRQAFLDAGLAEPTIRFTFIDSSLRKGAAIDRVLKRHPEMERFLTLSAPIPGSSESRILSNAATGEGAEYSTIQAIAAGVPRSYPFSGVWIHYYAPVFGERLIGLPKLGHSYPGVIMLWPEQGARLSPLARRIGWRLKPAKLSYRVQIVGNLRCASIMHNEFSAEPTRPRRCAGPAGGGCEVRFAAFR